MGTIALGAQWKSTDQMVDACIAALEHRADKVEQQTGDVSQIGKQDKIVEATYVTPFCDQAPMGTVERHGLGDRRPGRCLASPRSSRSKLSGLPPTRPDGYRQRCSSTNLHRRCVRAADLRRRCPHGRRHRQEIPPAVRSTPSGRVRKQTRQGKYRPLVVAKAEGRAGQKRPACVFVANQASKGQFPKAGRQSLCTGLHSQRAGRCPEPCRSMSSPAPIAGPGYNSYAFMVESFIDECATRPASTRWITDCVCWRNGRMTAGPRS